METDVIKRKSRYAILDMLKKHPEWNIVDLGCGKGGACPQATWVMGQLAFQALKRHHG
tara:strand:+ start:173 stop:346 length:174 start_codon:yes stop_codon:yes gene_type:complete